MGVALETIRASRHTFKSVWIAIGEFVVDSVFSSVHELFPLSNTWVLSSNEQCSCRVFHYVEMANRKEWTKDKVFHLISIYEEKPIFWDVKNNEFKMREKLRNR